MPRRGPSWSTRGKRLLGVLDKVRSRGMGLDDSVASWMTRLLGRSPGSLPSGSPMVVVPDRLPESWECQP